MIEVGFHFTNGIIYFIFKVIRCINLKKMFISFNPAIIPTIPISPKWGNLLKFFAMKTLMNILKKFLK